MPILPRTRCPWSGRINLKIHARDNRRQCRDIPSTPDISKIATKTFKSFLQQRANNKSNRIYMEQSSRNPMIMLITRKLIDLFRNKNLLTYNGYSWHYLHLSGKMSRADINSISSWHESLFAWWIRGLSASSKVYNCTFLIRILADTLYVIYKQYACHRTHCTKPPTPHQ